MRDKVFNICANRPLLPPPPPSLTKRGGGVKILNFICLYFCHEPYVYGLQVTMLLSVQCDRCHIFLPVYLFIYTGDYHYSYIFCSNQLIYSDFSNLLNIFLVIELVFLDE